MNVQNPSRFKAGDYKSEITPVWCPGCGDFHVLLSLTKALAALGRPPQMSPSYPASAARRAFPPTRTAMGFTASMDVHWPSGPASKLRDRI